MLDDVHASFDGEARNLLALGAGGDPLAEPVDPTTARTSPRPSLDFVASYYTSSGRPSAPVLALRLLTRVRGRLSREVR